MSLYIDIKTPTGDSYPAIINMDHIVILEKISGEKYQCTLSTGRMINLHPDSVAEYKKYIAAKENHYKSK